MRLSEGMVLLIGLGPHAKRIYIKYLKEHNLNISVLVDLKSQKNKIKQFLAKNNVKVGDFYWVNDSEKDYDALPISTQGALQKLIKKHKIKRAIISTEPKAHLPYALFLLKNNISVLMDKPITAPVGIAHDISATKKLIDDYYILMETYGYYKILNPKLQFKIQCQRRFHDGFLFIHNYLNKFMAQYNVPISFIELYHCDGEWNMPRDFFERENHPYKYGYGKILHSGYHFFDLLTWFLECNKQIKDKPYDKCALSSDAYFPHDFFYTLDNEIYKKLFNTNEFTPYLQRDTSKLGEMDVFMSLNLYSKRHLMTKCIVSLLKSGFSRRAWAALPEDAYKSNGRIRHEYMNIQVGPLLNIQAHSYQAYEQKEREQHGGNNVGDLEHFDIYIFRNSELVGGKTFEKRTLDNLSSAENGFIGYNEQARFHCLDNFFNDIQDDADFSKHFESTILTSKVYQSIIGGGGKIEFSYSNEYENKYKIIARFGDKCVGQPRLRLASRGVVHRADGKIAIFYQPKTSVYKLVGGGIDDGENPREAFRRECREEIGVEIDEIRLVGCVEENYADNNFRQISFVYTAISHGKAEKGNLTEDEKQKGSKAIWLTPTNALQKMKTPKGLMPIDARIIKRDAKILEHIIDNNPQV
jgi:ADP-ribose pyrophosphatase YjhB (NUDIX family)